MNKHVSLLCLGLWLGLAMNAPASGSYRIAIPKPNPKAETKSSVDRDKYALGQQIFNGKLQLTAQSDMAAQKLRLEKCQSCLPSGVAKSKSLADLAGKLTDEQLAALEYYLGQRYPVK
jgi:hypothetical protein